MPYFFTKKIRENYTGVHYATLVGCTLQFLAAIILIALSLSLTGVVSDLKKAVAEMAATEPSSDETSSDSKEYDGLYEFLLLQKKIGIAYALPVLFNAILGGIAYGAFNRPAAIVHTILNSLAIVAGLGCLIVPLFESAILGATCIAVKEEFGAFKIVHLFCDTLKSHMDAITVLIALGAILCFVFSIMGCVGVSRMRNYSKHVEMGYAPAAQDAYTARDPNYHHFSQPLTATLSD